MNLSTFIESLLISIQLNINLPAWLVSMELCPKRNFISILHLPVQIKVHKENIRTKFETSETYSEPYETSKMELLGK